MINKVLAYIGIGMILIIAAQGIYIKILRADLKAEETLRKTAEANDKQCQADKLITSEASNDYQTKLSALNNQLANIKRVRNNPRCIPIARQAQ